MTKMQLMRALRFLDAPSDDIRPVFLYQQAADLMCEYINDPLIAGAFYQIAKRDLRADDRTEDRLKFLKLMRDYPEGILKSDLAKLSIRFKTGSIVEVAFRMNEMGLLEAGSHKDTGETIFFLSPDSR